MESLKENLGKEREYRCQWGNLTTSGEEDTVAMGGGGSICTYSAVYICT